MTHFMKYYIFSILIGMIAHNNNVGININDCDMRSNINNTTLLRTNRLLLSELTIEENVTKIKQLETSQLEESKVRKSKNRLSRNKSPCFISQRIKSANKRLHEELEDAIISSHKGCKNNSIHDIKNRKSYKIKLAYSKFLVYYLMSVITFVLPPVSLMIVGYMLRS